MMDNFIYRLAIYLPGFLFAVVCHEWAHAYVALRSGDDTAKNQGRLTLNPMAHLDMMGTVIWPLICLALPGGFVFGYAKPVPVNPSRFKKFRQGLFWVSFAGPGMNMILGTISAFLLAVMAIYIPESSAYKTIIIEMLKGSMLINFILAVFNLIPFPPLDGSKMVTSMLDYNKAAKYEELQKYSLVFLLVLWFSNIAQYIFYPAMLAADYLPRLFFSLLV